MKSTGIVVEYNPFHNGHAHHLQQAKEKTNADVIIAVMSGNFLQRGEPAIVSKHYRTKMALEAGVDLVVELPYAFATQHAEIFATGAVQILSALGCNFLCFGSEAGNIELFNSTISFIEENNTKYNAQVSYYMDKGFSYPKACSLAFQDLKTDAKILDLSKPNNILGYHYIKAIKDNASRMEGITIQRIHSGYHDIKLSNSQISSATSIRKALIEEGKDISEISNQFPVPTYEQLQLFKNKYNTLIHWENYWPLLKYKLIQCDREELSQIYEMEEGLEHRFISMAKQSESFQHFMSELKTKRYTWTRLQRICTHVLTNTKKEDMKERCRRAEYIRLLGMNEKGRQYLKINKEKITLPIVSKLSSFDEKTIRLDVKAGQIYAFGVPHQLSQQLLTDEYKQPPIII